MDQIEKVMQTDVVLYALVESGSPETLDVISEMGTSLPHYILCPPGTDTFYIAVSLWKSLDEERLRIKEVHLESVRKYYIF